MNHQNRRNRNKVKYEDYDYYHEKEAIIGRVKKSKKRFVVLPLDSRADYIVKVPFNKELKETQLVAFHIKKFYRGRKLAKGIISDIIGYEDDKDIDEKIVISKFNIIKEFSKESLEEAERIKAEEIQNGNYIDLSNELIFTIDGEDAKDFDDAVSITLDKEGNYILGVHIADVSFFVKEGSKLDYEAFLRGTSIYFPDRAIPMLPDVLSSGLCSLQPYEKRLAISIKIKIAPDGKIKRTKIFKSIISSKARLTYNGVQRILDGEEKIDEQIKNSLLLMNELAKILYKKRYQRGALDFDFPEPIILLDRNLNISGINKTIRLDSHRIIEEFMILANETIANYLERKGIPFIYRVHEIPDPFKVEQFFEAYRNLGFKVPNKFDYTKPFSFQKILFELEGKAEANFVSYLMLRSFKQATYAINNSGHFGLASKCYTHFTSPIRRYPDLINHRILTILMNKNFSDHQFKKYERILPTIAAHSSEAERKADDAERYIINMKRARFMKNYLGSIFDGIISGLSYKKIFVEIIEPFVEGFIPVNTLIGDIYYFDERKYAIIGKKYNKSFRLGQKVKVKLIAADPLRNVIELCLIE